MPPPIRRPKQFLPPIGFGIPAWLQNWCASVKTSLEGLMQNTDLPGAPTNLISPYSNAVIQILSWNAAPNAARYRIYQNGTSNFSAAVIKGETTATRFIDSRDPTYINQTLMTGGLTFYWVSALNAVGQESTPAFLRLSSPFSIIDNTGAGAGADIEFRVEEGPSDLVVSTDGTDRWRVDWEGYTVFEEITTNPNAADLTAGEELALYRKADTITFAYNSLGTVFYLTCPADGLTTVWSISTTGP